MDINTVTALATLVLALLTAALAFFTYELAKEARLKRIEDASPNVILTVEMGQHIRFLDLVIENVGKGVAYDIAITPTQEITENGQISGRNHNNSSYYQIGVLKPNQRIRTFFAEYGAVSPQILRWDLLFYGDVNHTSVHRNQITVDLGMFRDMGMLGSNPQLDVAQALKDIRDSLRYAISNNRLRVDAFNSDDRAREREELEERLRRRRHPPQDSNTQ